MQLLGAAEPVGGGQRVADGVPLPGHSAARVIAYITTTPATVLVSVRRPGWRALASGRMSPVAM